MKAVEVEDLFFRYEGSNEWVLKGAYLSVKEGETLLIAGKSGSGKSTLLRSIVGLIPHVYKGELKGEVRLFEEPLSKKDIKEIVRRVGYVSQNPDNQIVSVVVERDVAFSLENLGYRPEEARKKIDWALEMLGIAELRKKLTFELSDGQKARVVLAGALAREPELMILDEPTAFLDPCVAKDLLKTAREINVSLGTTFMIVEHRLEVAKEFADRQVCVDAGKVIEGCNAAESAQIEGLNCTISRGETAVEMKGVSFSYPNGQKALEGVSLKAEKGELILIMGRNGSGKSTLLKLLNGTLKPSKGEVVIHGSASRERKELTKKVGFAPQNPDKLLFADSVLEEIKEGPKNFGIKNSEFLAEAAAELFRIERLLNRVPITLSWGEKKLVSIASSISWGPSVVAMDEPTAGLDRENKEVLARAIAKLLCSGKAVFVATHDVEFVKMLLPLNPRAVVLSKGRIMFEGEAKEITKSGGELICRL